MIPTLLGRLQTRVFILVVIGSLVTLAITPILPNPNGDTYGTLYRTTFLVLAAVLVLGLAWEFLYHGLMQFRWEKDWPTWLGLVTAVNEGALVWLLIKVGAVPKVSSKLPFTTFFVDFFFVWTISFLFVNGPMRVPYLRWRHRGGRLV